MPYMEDIFLLNDITFHDNISLRDASFHGDILFEMVIVQFEPLIKIKIKFRSNGYEWRGTMKDENLNEGALVYL